MKTMLAILAVVVCVSADPQVGSGRWVSFPATVTVVVDGNPIEMRTVIRMDTETGRAYWLNMAVAFKPYWVPVNEPPVVREKE